MKYFLTLQDNIQRAEWERKIPRQGFSLTVKHKVCALHFLSEYIITQDETVMPDGSIHIMKRERPMLHKRAVPTIFPNCPAYLSSYKVKRKSPKRRRNTDIAEFSTVKRKRLDVCYFSLIIFIL